MALRALDDPSLPGRDLTSVRSISLGGAPVPPELVGRLRAAFPNADRGISTIYGMTETGGTVAAASGATMARHPGTSGRPLAVVELRIDRPDDRGVGEILVRTPGQMLGYWGDASSEVIDGEGFVHTGDLGRMEDELLHLTGRSKDIVIRGGENIAAPHVEAVLLEHPGVSSVAVVGLPHAELGEEVGAAVVARRGSALDAESLATFLSGRLAHFEIPTRWWLWTDQLPANDAGKVDKRRLRESWPRPGS
jgi:long-chain acyl-CoA synthetase